MDIKTIARVGRFKDIVLTLFRYGLDDVVDRLELPGKKILARIHPGVEEMTTWERIRHTLEDLGPTFVKFGQILSLRPDLIPGPLVLELRKLQDQVPPVSFEAIKGVLEKELDRPLEEVFSHFDHQPMAAASLAQVHRAVLKEDRQVVAVKVQRPGIRSVVEKDLMILETIAGQLHRRMEPTRIYDLPGIVTEIKKTLFRELDFTREARHMKIARLNLAEMPEIRVPRVYDPYCTERVLTMELVQGTRLNNLDIEDPEERHRLASLGLRCTLRQILVHGFFHADPHPGNILLLDSGKLCLLDWGMVGRLPREARYALTELIQAVVEKDSERVVWLLSEFAQMARETDLRALQRDILDIIDSFHGVPLAKIRIGQLLMDATSVLQHHRIRPPADMALMAKAVMTAEGTARDLYPDLDVIAEAEPLLKQVAAERWQPREVWQSIRRALFRLALLQKNLPPRVERIIEAIDKGDLSIRFRHENLEGLRKTLESITNRLTFGIIIAALIIGSSMIITTGVRPLLFGFPALGVIGYLVSALLGLWLIFNIIRRRKL